MQEEMNNLGRKHKPFIFVIDYKKEKSFVKALDKAANENVYYKVFDKSNYSESALEKKNVSLKVSPPSFERYKKAFKEVLENQKRGNSYLLNLTMESGFETNLSLWEIFLLSKAPYKLFFNDKFVVFSPESFVQIKEGVISSYPMKGTIDKNIANAKEIILSDKKEYAEHVTIVDLIRNDLSLVSKNVRVERFRYIDEVKTKDKTLLQVSSKICGDLKGDYHARLGDIIYSLLPAGSISGAPKKKTLEIIEKTEGYERGYYTGVFGIYDGQNLQSAVMIRFVENAGKSLLYKSGGGITIYSDLQKEYEELKDKVYVPIH